MNSYGWLIYNKQDAERNKNYIDWFIRESELQSIDLQLVLREDISIGVYKNKLFIHRNNNTDASLPDFAVVRLADSLLNLQLEKAGVTVFNSAEVSKVANDKALAHLFAAELGIPMLDTFFIKKKTLDVLPPLEFPFVMKQTDGRSGKQITKVENKWQWQQVRERFFDHDTIIQTAEVISGKDLRVYVIGKEIIAAVLRLNDNDFRANVSLGGKVRLYSLSPSEKELINKFLESWDFGLVGIDFLFDQEENLLFNEIEDPVGSRSLSQVSSINLLQKYVTFIKKQLGDS